ncbi:MHYT domain-containing protein [Nocardiopsis ansamitocini]|uniref:MHYT domain-containing protein n=1 Tax=Nocardiopsis ansamitocini TaxID=1670832 RepID=UPI002552F6FD|nr:MHYT domain-containing protein [Nocardiopsis ansamitocini]
MTPGLAYLVSFVGSLLGLAATSRARTGEGAIRWVWLGVGAISIGFTGIWAMHFIAMVGFGAPGVSIRYDMLLTVLSALLATAFVGVGLTMVTLLDQSAKSLLLAGTITGLGVAGMHYTGVASMRLNGHLTHDYVFVAVAVVIAVVAATAALWAILNVRGKLATVGAALVMGVAVSSMHYVGMLGMGVEAHTGTTAALTALDGAGASDVFVPLSVALTVFSVLLALVVILSPSAEEVAEEQRVTAELNRLTSAALDGDASFSPGASGGRHERR